MMMRLMAVSLTLTILAAISLVGAGVSTQAGAPAPDWTMDRGKSRLGFKATQMGLPFEGRFKAMNISIAFDPELKEQGSVDAEIALGSIDTGHVDRDAAVQGPDWFDSANNPVARFYASRFVKTGDGLYEAYGKFTLRKTTRDVVLPFELKIDNGLATMHGELTIDRVDYGVGIGDWASGQTVGRKVTIVVDLVARRADAAKTESQTGQPAQGN
jgi:polyisoprenoid-binding protein YceI